MNLLESSVIQMPNIFCHVIIFPNMIYGYLKNSVSLLELPSNLGKYTCYS